MPETPENEPGEEQDLITCTGCGRIVPDEVDFCPHCGTPLSGFSTIDPYKRIFAEGNMYWRLTHSPPSPIVVIGLTLAFGASVLTCGVAMWLIATGTATDWSQIAWPVGCLVVYLLVASAFWYRVFQNYRRHAKRGKDE